MLDCFNRLNTSYASYQRREASNIIKDMSKEQLEHTLLKMRSEILLEGKKPTNPEIIEAIQRKLEKA